MQIIELKNMIMGTINLVDGLNSSGGDRGLNQWTWRKINRICSVWKNREKVDWKKNKQRLRDPWEYKKDSIFVSSESQEGKEKKESRVKRVSEEIMAESFPNLAKDTNLKIQEYKWILKQGKPKEILGKTYHK